MSDFRFSQSSLPNFSIDVENIVKDLDNLLKQNRLTITNLLDQKTGFTWENLLHPLEDLQERLHQFWSPINHLQSVLETKALREAYHKAQPLLSAYHMEFVQNETLYKAIKEVAESAAFKTLSKAQQKIIENDIRDFKLAGIHLNADEKKRFADLQLNLIQLMSKFSENLLDATQNYTLHIKNIEDLAGLPEASIKQAEEKAKAKNLSGYIITLDYPSYSAAIKFLEKRELREKLYKAYVSRASEFDGGKWNNTPIIDEILQKRFEMASLLGFKNYAEYSLTTKMAKTPAMIFDFLDDLLGRAKPVAEAELNELCIFAKGIDPDVTLEAWDIAYYSEKLCEQKFNFSPEAIRPYFPLTRVLNGMFDLVNKLYGISIQQQTDIECWHKDVAFFAIYDEGGGLQGGFYIDLYAREHKRGGAWMDEYRCRRLVNNQLHVPIAYLTCNFMPPLNDQPALLTHDEVITLFHEFGHCLHHLLTKVNFPAVGGINGIAWDAVEFPSQFMENFCWESEVLKTLSGHYQTNEPIPQAIFNNMLAAKNFHAGLMLLRQIEFSIFDLRIHVEYNANEKNQVQKILDEIRQNTSLFTTPFYNRFQNSFSHIFGGSYAAGYYSYKWAEVLSADAFEKFIEAGIYNREIGRQFLTSILETGGVTDPMENFIAFRGRKPTIDALIKHYGLS